MKKQVKNPAKKALLKKLVKAKTKGSKKAGSKNPSGASPFKLDNGLGNVPLSGSVDTSGGGSNLGTSGVF